MDTIVEDFTNMYIDPTFEIGEPLMQDFYNLNINSSSHQQNHSTITNSTIVIPTPIITSPTHTKLICTLYLENKRLKQEIAQLRALIFSQEPNIPHWVK
tara:strand:- start:4014 stop:4310 length:297 start_codon:yes stop_codon:yes gene_type:complete